MVAIPTMPIPHLVVYADVDVAMVAIAYSHTHDLVQCSDTPPVLHPPVSHLPPMHTHYSHNDEHKPIHSLEQLHSISITHNDHETHEYATLLQLLNAHNHGT
jgi:hypothetical protein